VDVVSLANGVGDVLELHPHNVVAADHAPQDGLVDDGPHMQRIVGFPEGLLSTDAKLDQSFDLGVAEGGGSAAQNRRRVLRRLEQSGKYSGLIRPQPLCALLKPYELPQPPRHGVPDSINEIFGTCDPMALATAAWDRPANWRSRFISNASHRLDTAGLDVCNTAASPGPASSCWRERS
jgi:hypothetical protein